MSDLTVRLKQFKQVYPDFVAQAAALGITLVGVHAGHHVPAQAVSRSHLMFDLDSEVGKKIVSQLPSDLIWTFVENSTGKVAQNWDKLNEVTIKDNWLQDGTINPLEVRFNMQPYGLCVASGAEWLTGYFGVYPGWKVTQPIALSTWTTPSTNMTGGTNAEFTVWNTAGAVTMSDLVTTLQGIFKTLVTVPTPDQSTGGVTTTPQPDTTTKNDINAVAEATAAGVDPSRVATTLPPKVVDSIVKNTLAKLQGQTPPAVTGVSEGVKNAIDTATSAATGAPPAAQGGLVSGIASVLGLGGNKEVPLKAPPPPPPLPPLPQSITNPQPFGSLVSRAASAPATSSYVFSVPSWTPAPTKRRASKKSSMKRKGSRRRSASKRKRSTSKRRKSTKRKSSRRRH